MSRKLVVLVMIGLAGGLAVRATAEDITLDKAGLKITEDAKVQPGKYALPDPQNTGAIHIAGEKITVDFQGAELDGASAGQLADAFLGRGLVITGKDITIKNLKVRGYKVGIYAHDCPGLVVEDVDISGNYQKHLLSTPEAEDGSDWLFPHRNDNNEWMTNYGAGLYIENAEKVTVRRVRARNGQNGIILDRVNDGKIYDNDCSFISGWGLALWRSSRNVITRNAFDFCVRGYSHGVYNRGQDSAGILMFEQCNENIIAENSVTHGGDGFFGFGGEESLSGSGRTGCNGNLLINNDFSYAPAHGIEMTFSFDNKFIKNRMAYNAICGVWGGYSQDTLIAGNKFEGNGEMAYGLERGGVNIEHGRGNKIIENEFKDNKCGVHLWSDDDANLLDGPWCKANHKGSVDNLLARNEFAGDKLAVHLRESKNTVLAANKMSGVGKEVDAAAGSEPTIQTEYAGQLESVRYAALGEIKPVGARKELQGREHIIMTEWGPYNYTDVAVFPAKVSGAQKATVQVLGPAGDFKVTRIDGAVKLSAKEGKLPGSIVVEAPAPGMYPFALDVTAGGKELKVTGSLLWADWTVKFFKWEQADDPREHQDKWATLIGGTPLEEEQLPAIDFKWGGGAPSDKVPGDHFGTVATTSLDLPEGKYEIWTVSDDGIRVWVDEKKVIDDWTWHPPKENATEVSLTGGKHEFRVEHFEIDGASQLQVRIARRP